MWREFLAESLSEDKRVFCSSEIARKTAYETQRVLLFFDGNCRYRLTPQGGAMQN